ncbi:unnamed protein product (macronuclear) [Paramecium tetraurelia]|uniref:MORN repeat protein n=1 Tax=Paramecium tetraurelia TaxID=5888 RepID=A0DKY4_PARTE|nr:uncharacterized protein GSPATT00018018001 [Paramecium tetraurelia]CAK83701.1 unnamed protein product [Paramecium tetraurelia]|eukprot:XP_001451098.1 hypothetical protein (macronuclear) [Paramecium tetraurelia strain d4-2]
MYNTSFYLASPQPAYIQSSYFRYYQPPVKVIIKPPNFQIQQPPISTTRVYHTQPIIPPRHSNSIHQSYITRTMAPPTQQMPLNTSYQQQPFVRSSIPYQPQSQQYSKSFHQQQPVTPQVQSRQSKPAPQSKSNYQAAPQYQHKPQYSQPPILSQQDDDLEKKFQDAIDRTRDLVQKYNKPQPKQEEQQQLQDLALQYEDGYIYRGQGYEPATREGFGVLNDQNDNEVYSGYWQDNQYHGQGKLINYSAEEINGPFDYRDLSVIENGWLSYEGEFYQGKMQGNGALYLTNGERYEGQFNDGMIEGKGVFITQDGEQIEGIWREGVLEN